MVHGCGVDAARQRIIPARTRTSGLASTVFARALARSLTLPLALALAILAWLLRGCAVRDGSSAAAPPSASLPSGVTGRRIRSLIHASLLSLRSHIYEPLVLAMWSNVQKLAWLRLNTSLNRFSCVRLAPGNFGARNACTGSAAIGGRFHGKQLYG
jgi:hypothetical protein